MIRLFFAALALVCLSLPATARSRLSLDGVHHDLRTKVRGIVAACPGAMVISAVRHTRIRGSRRMSLHASGRAVDMQGNPSCIYAQLQDWPGGYTTDYGRVRHVHISIGGPEHGLRFAHGGGRKKAKRHARQHRTPATQHAGAQAGD